MMGSGSTRLLSPPVGPLIGWSIAKLSFRYGGASRYALESISAEFAPGACTAILGPNGSGKSTLLKVMLRSLAPERGELHLGGRPLPDWSRVELARSIGVVPQNEHIAFPVTVRHLVSMGRYPHLGLLRPERTRDRDAIERAMIRCAVAEFQDRLVDTLSGGEFQRARLARALAQEPRVLVLDEPTRALDVRYEMEIFELLRDLVAEGVTVVLVTHNLNLAARYADALLLLNRGRLAAHGSPADVLRQDLLETVYEWPVRTMNHPGPGPDTGVVQVTPLSRECRPDGSSTPNAG